MRVVRISALLAVVTLVISMLVPNSAGALTNVYKIEARLKDSSGRTLCLDADANHQGAGTAVNLQVCNTNTAQQWQVGSLNNEPISINVHHPGYALASGSLTSGSAMELKAANGNDKTQGWSSAQNADQVVWNVNTFAPNVLVLAQTSVTAGTRVYAKTGNGTGLQQWVVIRLS
jgi:hypothetical protein